MTVRSLSAPVNRESLFFAEDAKEEFNAAALRETVNQKKERIFPGKKLVTREPSTGRTCNGFMASKQDHVVHF